MCRMTPWRLTPAAWQRTANRPRALPGRGRAQARRLAARTAKGGRFESTRSAHHSSKHRMVAPHCDSLVTSTPRAHIGKRRMAFACPTRARFLHSGACKPPPCPAVVSTACVRPSRRACCMDAAARARQMSGRRPDIPEPGGPPLFHPLRKPSTAGHPPRAAAAVPWVSGPPHAMVHGAFERARRPSPKEKRRCKTSNRSWP